LSLLASQKSIGFEIIGFEGVQGFADIHLSRGRSPSARATEGMRLTEVLTIEIDALKGIRAPLHHICHNVRRIPRMPTELPRAFDFLKVNTVWEF
jgi:hypothetical protein